MLYFAFVYPHLLYGIEIYGNTNTSNNNRLKILNNKILRILQTRHRRSQIIDVHKSYSVTPHFLSTYFTSIRYCSLYIICTPQQ